MLRRTALMLFSSVGMIMGMAVLMFMFMFMLMVMTATFVAVVMWILAVLMSGALVDVKLHSLDVLALRTVIMHVKIAKVQLAKLPFQSAGLNAQVDERADSHVATNAGNAVEENYFHIKSEACGEFGKVNRLVI
jgi:hypothetical protein